MYLIIIRRLKEHTECMSTPVRDVAQESCHPTNLVDPFLSCIVLRTRRMEKLKKERGTAEIDSRTSFHDNDLQVQMIDAIAVWDPGRNNTFSFLLGVVTNMQ